MMERIEAVEALVEIQAYGQAQAEQLGLSDAGVLTLVEAALANPDPQAAAVARLICSGRKIVHPAARSSSNARELSEAELLVRGLILSS